MTSENDDETPIGTERRGYTGLTRKVWFRPWHQTAKVCGYIFVVVSGFVLGYAAFIFWQLGGPLPKIISILYISFYLTFCVGLRHAGK